MIGQTGRTGSKLDDRSWLCAVSGESRSRAKNVETKRTARGATALGMHMWGPRGEVGPLVVPLACPGQIAIAWEFF